MQKSSTIDFWLGSKYGSWRCCQKKVFILKTLHKLCKTFCLYSYHAYLILLLKLEKCVTERNKRLTLWTLFIDQRNQFLIPADWIIENDLCQSLMHVVLEFLSNGEGLNRSLRHVLPKLSKINDLSKVSETNWIGSILTCPKLAK